jgi:hypothetical protein
MAMGFPFYFFDFFSRGLQALQKASMGFRQRDITGVWRCNDVHDGTAGYLLVFWIGIYHVTEKDVGYDT